MQLASRLFSAATLALFAATSFAAPTIYTLPTTFLPLLAPGAYTETFSGLSTSGLFSSGAFSYALTSPGDLYASGDFLGTNSPNEALTITFTSGNVTAFGANFFSTNLSDVFQAVAMKLTLSDGTVVAFTPATVEASYRGFVSTVAITSVVIGAPGQSLYAGLDNLTVGRALAVPAVPEPTTWALLALGLAGVVVARRRAA